MRISDWSSDVCSSDLENKGLREAIEDIQARNEYTINAFFQPFRSSDAKDRLVNKNVDSFLPNFDHWAVIATNSTLGRFLMGRPLPTQGMQMIAFAAVLGFKTIYVVGIDLYEDAARSEEHTSELKSLMRRS